MVDIIHITPEFPPDHGGVSDYAHCLYERGEAAGIRQLVFSSTSHGRFRCPETGQSEIDHDGLVRALRDAAPAHIVFQYSPYGYARWGLCGALVRNLIDALRHGPELQLTTILHEGYATASPLSLAFWTSFPQKFNLKMLSTASHRVCTASPHLAALVDNWAGRKFAEFIPVFSNVGEPEIVRDWNERESVAVVFGGAGRRREVYSFLETSRGEKILRELQLDRIIDIGPSIGLPAQLADVELTALGLLEPAQISSELQDARFGLLDYPSARLTKSGIAAAYFAHRVCCIRTSGKQEGIGHPQPGQCYLDLATSDDIEVENLREIAEAGHQWYADHTVSKVAARILGVETV